jgi:hypothetical protein
MRRPEVVCNLADLYTDKKNWYMAQDLYKRAAIVMAEAFDPHHHRTQSILRDLTVCLQHVNKESRDSLE